MLSGAAPLPPEVEVASPGAVLVVDEDGRLRDRSPRASVDPVLGALVGGELVPEAILRGANARRLVHDGAALDAVWLALGEPAPPSGLDERDFAAMLHKLRNVVGILVASLDTEDLVGSGPASSQVGSMRRREVDRLVDVVSTLGLAFGPSSARGFVDLELSLRRTLDALRGTAQRRDIQLRLEGGARARRPRTGDEPLLAAALHALVSNAIEASDAGGQVLLQVSEGPASITISVEDQGPGLLRPARGEPGAPFQSSKRGGVGLGLVVAKRAAFVHGGELHVATRAGGRGVGALLWLPTAER
jgi:signal transduction histidine kinase